MTGHRVLVCGGRDYSDAARLWSVLDHYHGENPFALLMHGAARGADSLAGDWACRRGLMVLSFPADWNRWPKAAGHIRNARMLHEGKPTVVVAFPGGRGTANMIEQAERAGVPVVRVP